MWKRIKFFLKYRLVRDLTVEQYNTGLFYVQALDLKDMFIFLDGDINLNNIDKLQSFFKEQHSSSILSHLASCAVKPRFGKWKAKNRMNYVEDINKSLDTAILGCAFFLSNNGVRLNHLANFLKATMKIKQ